jgi:hypothetical protein
LLDFSAPSSVYYPVAGDNMVEAVRYMEGGEHGESGRVYINAGQFFENVPGAAWTFTIGGYEVCKKWLKDRRGRRLSNAEVERYRKIVYAVGETVRLMEEVDGVIEVSGGWPIA